MYVCARKNVCVYLSTKVTSAKKIENMKYKIYPFIVQKILKISKFVIILCCRLLKFVDFVTLTSHSV